MFNRTKIIQERRIYFSTFKDYFINRILKTDSYYIWKFIFNLRRTEYCKEKSRKNKLFILFYIFYKRKKNKLGQRLGFDIPEGCFAEGLRIYHKSSIVINPYARIGKNCIIVGNCCIGNINGSNTAPTIGDNCMIGWGGTIIGNISIPNNCQIGAHAVVTKTILQDNAVLVGVPARNIHSNGGR